MKPIAVDPVACQVCAVKLPARWERDNHAGRPRRYCSRRCACRAERLRKVETLARAHDLLGRDEVAARIREHNARKLSGWRAEAADPFFE